MKPGSHIYEGWTYQQNPFEPGTGKVHRQDSSHRLRLLKTYCDFSKKHVIDLGCNLGYFGFMLDHHSYIGIDYDGETIDKARAIHKSRPTPHPRMDFMVRNIRAELVRERAQDPYSDDVGRVKVLLVFSVLPWLIKAGNDLGELMQAFTEYDEVYLELMYEGDGMSAGMEGITNDHEARAFLQQYFTYVTRLGSDPKWRDRTMWKCSMHLGALEHQAKGRQSTLDFTDRGYVIKRYEHEHERMRQEYGHLLRFDKYDIAPKPVACGGQGFVMSRIYGHQPTADEIREAGYLHISTALNYEQVLHRDIRPENLLVAQGKLYLLDFEWAADKEDTSPYPDSLGSFYKVPGFGNRATFENVLKIMEAGAQ